MRGDWIVMTRRLLLLGLVACGLTMVGCGSGGEGDGGGDPDPPPVTTRTLSGRVVNSLGFGVAGASVVATRSNGVQVGSTVTDANGNYTLPNIPANETITVTVSGTGIETTAQAVAPGASNTVNVTIPPATPPPPVFP